MILTHRYILTCSYVCLNICGLGHECQHLDDGLVNTIDKQDGLTHATCAILLHTSDDGEEEGKVTLRQ